MSAVSGTVSAGTSASWPKRHPVLAYSIAAYAFTFLPVILLVLAQQFGLVSAESPAFSIVPWLLPFGPFVAALLVSAAEGGRTAVGELIHRIVQWRVGLQWYLLVLIGIPVLMMIGAVIVYGSAPLDASASQWQQVLAFWLPTLILNAVFTGLGEEPGWRGFMLPRLQAKHGPLVGTLILGIVWTFWHLPNMIMNGWGVQMWMMFWLATMISAFVLTWVYNSTRGSVLLPILVHSAQNSSTWVLSKLLPTGDELGYHLVYIVMAGVAVAFILLATRGRLGKRAEVPQVWVAA